MNYTLIESFCALAQRLNFTKAAADLFITQPTLSRNIAALENELGVQLFHRNNHSVCLTEFGKQFLPYADRIKRANDDVASFTRAFSKRTQSSIIKEARIGVATLQFTKFLPAFISYMNSEMPDVRFCVINGLQKNIFQQLKDNKLDIIFTDGRSLENEKGLDTLLVRRNYMKLVVPVGHPAAKLPGPVPLSMIPELGLPLLTIDTTLSGWSKDLFPTLEIKQMQSDTHGLSLIESGLGFSICQEGMREIFPPSVAFLDIENDPLYMDATIAWIKNFDSLPWQKDLLHNLSVFVDAYSSWKLSK